MDRCPSLQEISSCVDHAAQPLSPQHEAVARHLECCPACRRIFEDFRNVDLRIRSLPLEVPDPAFSARILARIGTGAPGTRRSGSGRGHAVRDLIHGLTESLADWLTESSTSRIRTTGTLDEFQDFPPLSLGAAYVKLLHHGGRSR